jgi:hypothetical protein
VLAMAIESKLESIEHKGGDELIKEDKMTIRKALSTTEFVYNDFTWVTKENNLSIIDWITYEINTVFCASVLSPFVEKQLELQVDGKNDAFVRNLSNDKLLDIFSDLRYAKGTGEVSIYYRMLTKNGFTVYDASIQIERICHTVKIEIEFRME